MTQTIYKIIDRSTGLYSTGSITPRWTKKGKTWSDLGHVRSHLSMLWTWDPKIRDKVSVVDRYYDSNCEIVEYELVERSAISVL